MLIKLPCCIHEKNIKLSWDINQHLGWINSIKNDIPPQIIKKHKKCFPDLKWIEILSSDIFIFKIKIHAKNLNIQEKAIVVQFYLLLVWNKSNAQIRINIIDS